MDHFVRIARWPENLRVPEEYASLLVLDPEKLRIGYHGYMRKADFDTLARMSKDPLFLDALQELFAKATYEGESPRRSILRWLVAGGITAGAAGGLFAFFRHRQR